MGSHEPSPLLTLFKEQLRHEIDRLVSTHSLDNDGQGLIWWYFMKLHGMTKSEVEEVFCDGRGDLGIDAIYIDTSPRVHFYQFKNPQSMNAGFPTEDVDKVLEGLRLIIAKKHRGIANQALRDRIEEIYTVVPSGYTLHLVSSGSGISHEAMVKLKSFVEELKTPSEDFFTYEIEDLKWLQDKFYTRSLPTIEESIQFRLQHAPYMVRFANHDSYIFHLPGRDLADLYERFGEKLLQQNIRRFEGDNNSTNRAIWDSCTSDKASNFYHYNNGVTFLCEEAVWDHFSSTIMLNRAQVVNGGQTIRVLHRALREGALREEVSVSVRVITSRGDKEFAGDVAVNLNNQTRVESSFLRSNDPRVVQLGNALASLGWYLERREGEVDGFTDEEKMQLAAKLGRPLSDDNIIRLKEGTQAYAATYCRLPEVAKKNPKLLFLDSDDGGYFSKIFGSDISAEKFLSAYRLYHKVNSFVYNFKSLKRRRPRMDDWRAEYRQLLGQNLVRDHGEQLDQVIPQSVVFLTALLFERYVRQENWCVDRVIESIAPDGPSIATETLHLVLQYAVSRPDDTQGKSWPTLLKSQAFFDKVAAYILGQKARPSGN